MVKQYYVYVLSNGANTVTYTGVTNDLVRRVHEHKNSLVKGFTSRYKVHKLVYYEVCEEIQSTIAREKQIKGGSREDKVALISSLNGDWHDLYDES